MSKKVAAVENHTRWAIWWDAFDDWSLLEGKTASTHDWGCDFKKVFWSGGNRKEVRDGGKLLLQHLLWRTHLCSNRVQSKFGKFEASLSVWFAIHWPFCPKVAPHWLSFSEERPGGFPRQTCTSKRASPHKVEWLWWCLQVHSSASSSVQGLSLKVGVYLGNLRYF